MRLQLKQQAKNAFKTAAGNAVSVANGVTGESGCQSKPVTALKVLTPVTPFGHFVTSLRSRLLFSCIISR
jgi:hypothetical protein